LDLKATVSWAFSCVGSLLMIFSGENAYTKTVEALSVVLYSIGAMWHNMGDVSATLLDPNSWVINFNIPATTTAVNPELAYWPGIDRFWAILCGYVTVSFLAALYLRRGTPFSSGQIGQEWEASIIDLLNQASGVMKVILIISIEMLIFPLYCGLLLDAALLPLFENRTLKSRILFTINFPLTSIFVHWFVGTGYMFHFALFVSMCRKIMRRGVLCKYFDSIEPSWC
jgi:E3 ubiquitin-protein ligase MARCH6